MSNTLLVYLSSILCVDMIAYVRIVALGLILVFPARVAIETGEEECIIGCRRKVDVDVCNKTCLELLKGNATNETPSLLMTPGVPTNVSSGFRFIRLKWNATNISNQSAVRYIVEIQPNWTYHGDKVIFPYVEKYHYANETYYTVNNLLAKMSYKFRVVAVTLNETSAFSNWSNLIPTNNTCPIRYCSVTNVLLELKFTPVDKDMTDINATVRWEPTTSSLEGLDRYKSFVEVTAPKQDERYCTLKFPETYPGSGKKEELTTKKLSFHEITGSQRIKTEFHFGCKYTIEVGLRHRFQSSIKKVNFIWNFYIPRCISGVCGCKYVRENADVVSRFVNINLTKTSKNVSSINVTWDNEIWRDDINISYFLVNLRHVIDQMQYTQPMYVDFKKDIYEYSVSFPNLTDGQAYDMEIIAHHGDHCKDSKRKKLEFKVSYPCREKRCDANRVCVREKWLGIFRCDCVAGFIPVNGTCQEENPCRNNSCSQNSTCISLQNGNIQCHCDPGFLMNENNSCLDICMANPRAKGCDDRDANNTGAIIAAVVTPLVLITIIASLLFLYQRRYHKKRIVTITSAILSRDSTTFNSPSGTLNNAYNYHHPLRVAMEHSKEDFGDDTEGERNVIYVPQEIMDAIAQGLTDGLFELSNDQLKLGRVIGRGAFGEVYDGEAIGILNNPGRTKVAVKRLPDSATSEEIHDFLCEIKLMKTLGKHENVIEMYGCCTYNLPICLIMEFASGGNLIDYLRSLKRKCEQEALLRKDPGAQDMFDTEKNKFEKFFLHGEMPPDESTAYSFPCTEATSKDITSNNNVKQAEAENVEIATKVNQEIQTALDPKELESFARQIANGMCHVADLGIIHRDLAARNILLDGEKVLKISDFGLSREGTYIKKTGGKLPLRWLSIEAVQERRYSTASDVWAFGIVLWEICTLGDVPYPSVADDDLPNFLASGKRMKKAASCTDEIYEILLKCWSHRPEERPTFTELSKLLRKLEHEGNTYVNIEQLMTASPSQPAKKADIGTDDIETDDIEQETNPNVSCDPTSSPQTPPSGIDNRAFMNSVENLNCDEQQHILPRKQKSQFKNTDAENSTQPASNGSTSIVAVTEC